MSFGADNTATRSFGSGRFTLAGTAVLEVQHRCGTTRATDGWGLANNFAVIEVYSQIEIRKIA